MFKGHIIVTHRGFDSTTDFVQVYSFAHLPSFWRPFCEFNWDNYIDLRQNESMTLSPPVPVIPVGHAGVDIFVAETVGGSDIRFDD
jgi:hypothetical protein